MGIKIMKFLLAIAAAAALKVTDPTVGVEWLADGFYRPQDIGTGPLDKKYERVPPEHFAAESDDLFMHSMIMNYADEGLGTHKELAGDSGSEYLKTYFPRTWAHFDVNKEGRIGVETMPMFMRFLSSDQTLNIQ